jgi:thioester reductase-like protein
MLGLSGDQFDDLANSIDVIYHNGAWVNFIYPYSALRATNVLGTQEVLRLASQGNAKSVHYVSTLSVFSDIYAHKSRVKETEIPNFEGDLPGGYDQSKWAAEQLIREAQQRGLSATIYRLGTLMGHSETGMTHKPNDFFCSLLKGCLQLGKVPSLSRTLNITPVDYVSRALVYLSRQTTSLGQSFHIINPHTITWEAFVKLIQAQGYSLQTVSYAQWYAALQHQVNTQSSALKPFVPTLGSEDDFPIEKAQFDASLCQQAISKAGFSCPSVDDRLVSAYLSYFETNGYFADL